MRNNNYEKKRDEQANNLYYTDTYKSFGFRDGADWSREFHLAEIENLNAQLNKFNDYFHGKANRRHVGDVMVRLDAALMREEKLLAVLKKAILWIESNEAFEIEPVKLDFKSAIAENQALRNQKDEVNS